MNTTGQNTKQGTEENDVIKQFMEILSQQNMGEQSQGFMEILKYVAGMQLQLSVVADELQGMREQLAKLQESQPKTVTERLMDKVAQLQERAAGLLERLSAVKERLMETAAQAVHAFKEKGKAAMCMAVQKGLSGIKSMLADYQEKIQEVKLDYEKTANQIDSIGDELKQIGNSVSNVGRLIMGKGTKEVSDEKQGVALTRIMNSPIKNRVAHLQKNMDTVDRALEKLDQLSARFTVAKEAEKGGRSSVKDKLSQMKAKTEQQKKAPEPDKAAAKKKEVCL
jgi:hypothetical protein